MEKAAPKVKIFIKQKMMRKMMLALLPCVIGAIYYFGWRSLAMLAWAGALGFITEYIFARTRKEPVSEAVFVTTTIFTLIIPPTVPFHILSIGIIFAVMFAKEIFGGFGKNIFNPAMAGRCFIYICFPVAMTATWAQPAAGTWGALDRWTTVSTADTVTSATPMANLKAGKLVESDSPEAADEIPFDIPEGQSVKLKKATLVKGMLTGRISGTLGVTSAILVLIGGLYLFLTKTGNRTIILSTIITYAILNQVLNWLNVSPIPGAWPTVISGSFLFGAFFMATDPVSAPKLKEARIIYGMIIAICTVVIRNFSIFNGGFMFAILIANMFGPILDYSLREFKAKRVDKAKDR
ncbi:MAG: RnfABCDGE type electron transport complex subunit D [Planctomycetes bacterium]|nr:RnfABCDGE type electron transport complex subunit D [Planctomycetota bacterium]